MSSNNIREKALTGADLRKPRYNSKEKVWEVLMCTGKKCNITHFITKIQACTYYETLKNKIITSYYQIIEKKQNSKTR